MADGMTPIKRAAHALEPFAEFVEWAERNGHSLADIDLLVRKDGIVLGHAGFTIDDLIAARSAKAAFDALLEEGQ